MRVSLVVPVLLVLSAARLAAQDAAAVEVAGGYAFLNDQDSTYKFPAGWTASVGVRTTRWFDAIVDGGGSFKTLSIPGDPPRFTVYSLMGGPRFRLGHAGRVSPFAQVLFGVARATTTVVGISETARDFAYQPGAGIDVALRPHLAARLAGDYRLIRAEGQTSKESRVVVAAVIGIGR
jgi:opacity protein-like surface antigen